MRNSVSMSITLQNSCTTKSSKIKSKLVKFLSNLITCNKPQIIEGSSSINVDGDYVCEICVETRALDISFNIKGCSHFYCTECIVKYIESKLENNVTRITCPVRNCDGVLDPDFCLDILPFGLFNRWGKALCESALLELEKFYCPYNDCSALLIDDGNDGDRNSFYCPFCNRVFCVLCKVAWHEGFDCERFQKLKRFGPDALLGDLAERKYWKQCPNCKIYVAKADGCNHITCKCGIDFCYRCGAKYDKFHKCSV